MDTQTYKIYFISEMVGYLYPNASFKKDKAAWFDAVDKCVNLSNHLWNPIRYVGGVRQPSVCGGTRPS